MEHAMKQGLLRSLSSENKPHWLILLAAGPILLMAVLASHFHGHGAVAQRVLLISLASDQPGTLQVFFDLGSGFNEKDSLRSPLVQGFQTLKIALPDRPVKAIRLDPDGASGPLTLSIKNITLGVSGRDETREAQLTDLVALNGIAALEQTKAGGTLVRAQSAIDDPQLFLQIQGDRPTQRWATVLMRLVWYFLLFGLSSWLIIKLVRMPSGLPVPAFLFGSGLLIVAMVFATTSERSVHPDEPTHVATAKYYYANWQPPRVNSPEIADTYSVYGTSYHNELDVVYMLAAKASLLWATAGLDETTGLRVFNAVLFWALLIVVWLKREVSPAAVVLLLSPQIWYVFSYFNADALPLFLSMLLVVLSAAPSSPISRFVENGEGSRWALVLFIVALGLLLISKKNYLPVVFVTGLMLMVRHLKLNTWGVIVGGVGASLLLLYLVAGNSLQYILPVGRESILAAGVVFLLIFSGLVLRGALEDESCRRKFLRISLVMSAALVVAFPRLGADTLANGLPAEKAALLAAAAEQHADTRFKPSTLATDPEKSYPGLRLAEKGVTFPEIVGQPYAWWSNSWRSFLGVYGYMDIWAPSKLYWLLAAGWAGLGLSLVVWGSAQRGGGGTAFTLLCVGCFLVVLSSLIHSWANDFQPQGRYLFPGLAIIAFYMTSQEGLWRARLPSISILICFFGALASFIGVALPALVVR